MVLVPIQIMEITSFLSKAHNWKSPGSDQIQNYWLKALPVSHRHITKKFNAIMEELEKVPDWLTKGITYLLPKSGDSKEVKNYWPIMCLTTMYQTMTGIIARRISTHLEEQYLLPAEAKRMPTWNYRVQGSIYDIKSNIQGLQEEEQEFKYSLRLIARKHLTAFHIAG